ncbi:YtzI protein [Microaerobacter geothermalis]|nr:YtzI protein [Microaerobacter geothermalis]MCF6093672.1 YtzI protein [Microaerobacter geothermalis]
MTIIIVISMIIIFAVIGISVYVTKKAYSIKEEIDEIEKD